MSRDLDAWLSAVVRRRRGASLIDTLAPGITGSLFITAVVVVTIRIAIPPATVAIPALVVAGLLAPLWWLPRWWRLGDPPARTAGALDQLAGAQGLVMALAAMPAPARPVAWRERLDPMLERVALPPIPLRPLLPALLAGLCLGIGIALPQRESTPPAPRVPAPVRTVQDRVNELAQRGILSEAEREALSQQLQRTAESGLSQATWEGLDRLNSQLDARTEAAQRRVEEALAAADSVAALPSDATTRQLDEAASQLAAALADLQLQAPGLLPELSLSADGQALAAALQAAVERGDLSPAQAQALAEALRKSGLKPGTAGSPNPAAMAAASAALANQLASRCNGKGSCTNASLALGSSPGSGGVQRGWATPVETRHEARDRTDGGDCEGLAQGDRMNEDGSVTLATSQRTPEEEEAARQALARGASHQFDAVAADARTPAIAPRHRATVAGYLSVDPVESRPAARPTATSTDPVP